MKRLLLLLALALPVLPGLRAQAPAPAPPPVFTAQEAGVDEKLGAQVPLDLVLADEEGRAVRLGDLLGQPTVLTLNYFRCAGICTPQLNGVVDLVNAPGARLGQDYRIVTVSFDPRDTPEIASTKRSNYLREIQRPVSPRDWRFLTGEARATRALCDAVGFRFKPQGGDFIHAGVLVILSPEGRVTRYMYGVAQLPADLQMAVQEAGRGQARPTINKWLQFCYSADPQGRGMVFSVTKAAAWATLLLAGLFLGWLLVRRARAGKEV